MMMKKNSRLLKITALVLAVLLFGSSFLLYGSLEKISSQNNTINELNALSESQQEKITVLESNISSLESNLSATIGLLNSENQTNQRLKEEIINLTTVAKSDYYVLAVDQNNNGHVIPLEVIITHGTGNLYIDVANVVVDETLQSSAQTAVQVAREVTRTNLADKDVLINIKSGEPGQTLILAGGSGGAATTLAAMAAMQGKTLRKDVLITGTINPDHSIGQIGAAREKGLAAKENGAVLFLVPVGQSGDVGDIGIQVREVATIEDAARYAFPSS